MTIRLFFVLLYGLLTVVFFIMALIAKDEQRRQTWLLFSIWFALAEIAKTLGAIAIHTGAYPLWNNK